MHGIALWFDCNFPGAQRQITLGTAPTDPLTHWYQVRCMLRAPLPLGVGHQLTGSLKFEANEARGYNVHVRRRRRREPKPCPHARRARRPSAASELGRGAGPRRLSPCGPRR